MLVLFETAAGFALFKLLDEGKLNDVENVWTEFQTADAANKFVKLHAFEKFENTTEALSATTKLVEGKLSKGLRKFLKAQCEGDTLAVADSKLGRMITEKLEINCIQNSAVSELMRGIRSQLEGLITGLTSQNLAPMSLGLSHSLCRYTLKFSPDKVDTMIVQAIGLLDDLDKELNTYAMRVREWYGWHFPEMAKIVQDNLQYAKTVKLMASRTNAPNIDFSAILSEEVETELKEAVQVSMGTEISEQDMKTIRLLCDQVVSLSEYRGQLYDYLRSRMKAIAPNLTVLVGELVGARLIAHAGSLLNLAKQPASTVQILGAEKALFRALKTKHNTPKYGLIYHASLVGQAPTKFKGKISRVLAAKSALSIRYDALGESQDATIGNESRAKVEARLRQLEGRVLGKVSGVSKGKGKIEAYDKDRKMDTPGLLSSAKTYDAKADSTIGSTTLGKRKINEEDETAAVATTTEEEEAPKKKKKKRAAAVEEGGGAGESAAAEKKKKKEKEIVEVEEEEEEEEEGKKEKKKKKKKEVVEVEKEEDAGEGSTKKKKKKKKRKDEDGDKEADDDVVEVIEEEEKKSKKKKKKKQ